MTESSLLETPTPTQTSTDASSATQTSASAPASSPWDFITDPELKTNKAFAKFKGPEDALKSYVQLESTLGADKNSILKIPNAPYAEAPDAWSEVYDKLGRPKDYKEYDLKGPEGTDPATLEQFAQLAHKAGMTKTQVQAATDWFFSGQKAASEQQTQQRAAQFEATQTQLKQEFGNAYDEKIADAKRAITHYGGNELLEAVNSMGAGQNPAFIKAMVKIGNDLREAGLIKNDSSDGGQRQLSPTEARQKFNEYAADKNFQSILYTKGHPQQSWAKGEIDRLVKSGAMDNR